MYLDGIDYTLLLFVILIALKLSETKQFFNKLSDFDDVIEQNDERLISVTTKSPFFKLIHLPFLRHKKELKFCDCNDEQCSNCNERKKVVLKKIGPQHYFLRLFSPDVRKLREKRNITSESNNNLGVIDNFLKCIKQEQNLSSKNDFTMLPIVFGEVDVTNPKDVEVESDILNEPLNLTGNESSPFLNGPEKTRTTVYQFVNTPRNMKAMGEDKEHLQFNVSEDNYNCEPVETVNITSSNTESSSTINVTLNVTIKNETLVSFNAEGNVSVTVENFTRENVISTEAQLFTENTINATNISFEISNVTKTEKPLSFLETIQNKPEAVEVAEKELKFRLPNITNIFCFISSTTSPMTSQINGSNSQDIITSEMAPNLTFTFTTNTPVETVLNSIENATHFNTSESNVTTVAQKIDNSTEQAKNHLPELRENIIEALQHKNMKTRRKKSANEHQIRAGLLIYPRKEPLTHLWKRNDNSEKLLDKETSVLNLTAKCAALLKAPQVTKKQHCVTKGAGEILDLLNNINEESVKTVNNIKIRTPETTPEENTSQETESGIALTLVESTTSCEENNEEPSTVATMFPEDEAKFLRTAKGKGFGNSLYSELPSFEETKTPTPQSINFLEPSKGLEDEILNRVQNLSSENTVSSSTEVECTTEEETCTTVCEEHTEEVKNSDILHKIRSLEDQLKLVNELQNVIDGVHERKSVKRSVSLNEDEGLTLPNKVSALGKILRWKKPEEQQPPQHQRDRIRLKRFLLGKRIGKSKRNWQKLNERFLGRRT